MTDPVGVHPLRNVVLRATATASAVTCCIVAMWPVTTHAALQARSASARTGDPADLRALRAVCTQCHDVTMFAGTIQSRDEWIDTIQKMVERGARGTDDQFRHILHYLAENQMSVNVNTASVEDIAMVLGVPGMVAHAVVARRATKPFTGIADLLSVRGIDANRVRARRDRIGF